MQAYLDLLTKIKFEGHEHIDRTGTGRKSIFGHTIKFDMKDGFPLVTTRQLPFKAIVEELLWFISGSTDAKTLNGKETNIWSKWAVTETDIDKFMEKYSQDNPNIKNDEVNIRNYLRQKIGSVGEMYGASWRNLPFGSGHTLWPDITEDMIAKDKLKLYKEEYEVLIKEVQNQNMFGGDKPTPEVPSYEEFIKVMHYTNIDQLQNLINSLKMNPFSSRHVISAWVPQWLPFESLPPQENVCLERAALAPCHMTIQCFVTPGVGFKDKNKLSLLFYMRSSDVPVGLGFNIAQYALLLHMLAQVTGMEAHELIYQVGDAHVYTDQYETVDIQLERQPFPLPTLKLNPDVDSIYDFKVEDFGIENYQYHDAIKHPVSV